MRMKSLDEAKSRIKKQDAEDNEKLRLTRRTETGKMLKKEEGNERNGNGERRGR